MSKVMNKSDLIDAIATASDISKAAAARAVDAFVGFIVNSVSQDARVSLIGFGTFERRKRAARKGRNPQTGAIINIPGANVPGFKAGKAFKDALNQES